VDRRIAKLAPALVVAAAACRPDPGPPGDAACAAAAQIESLRLDQLQVIGSHNSYRRRTYPPILAYVRNMAMSLSGEIEPEAWDYDRPPLAEQLERDQVRGLEIDLWADPAGGHFFDRQGLRFVGEPVASNVAELREAGFKVLHVPDFDFETHHQTFRSALRAIAAWSDAHPRHLPLFIHLETKETTVADEVPGAGFTAAIPYDLADADAIDAEIRSVLSDTSRIITPDQVRGAHATLEEAVLAGGWPTLAASRGRVLFYLEGPGIVPYVAGAPGLRGRLVFASARPGQAHAAVVIANDAVGSQAAIADLVRRGYIVRTMADGGTVQARTGDETSMRAALASGAQIVTTDYARPDPRGETPGSGWTRYQVRLPGGGPARANPVNGGAALRICE
jgi:hypothetical protein